ncbi:MAG: hypothetical protein IAF38_03575 [Bacteroidia bacterium]|nr:hypothetical protein [Bacteroidia bacterium]
MTNLFDDAVSTRNIFNVYLKNFKLILFTVIACTIIAIVASFIVKPRYAAKASFFIPLNTSLESALENPQLGYDVEVDRLLQIINSTQFEDSVIKKFDLINYSKVDTSDFEWKDKINSFFRKRVRAGRTNAMSIFIEAETHAPEFSSEIVNYMVGLTQRSRERFYKTNGLIAVQFFKADYLKKRAETDSLKAILSLLRNELKSSGGMVISGNQIITQASTINPANLGKQLELEITTQRYIAESTKLQLLKEKYESALNLSSRPIPKMYIVDNAVPIYSPVYPLLGFNISVGFLGSLLFMLAALYLKHIYFSFIKKTGSA